MALIALDGFELDVPDTPANAAASGYASEENRSAFPKVRVVTIGECGSHTKIAAQTGPVGGKGSCEQAAICMSEPPRCAAARPDEAVANSRR